MRGGGRKPYVVEEVPYVLSFDHGQALHGALWHDRFGNRGSHGCVNLAPADASTIPIANAPIPIGSSRPVSDPAVTSTATPGRPEAFVTTIAH